MWISTQTLVNFCLFCLFVCCRCCCCCFRFPFDHLSFSSKNIYFRINIKYTSHAVCNAICFICITTWSHLVASRSVSVYTQMTTTAILTTQSAHFSNLQRLLSISQRLLAYLLLIVLQCTKTKSIYLSLSHSYICARMCVCVCLFERSKKIWEKKNVYLYIPYIWRVCTFHIARIAAKYL